MKVLLLNGSTRKNGCTYLALSEAAKALQEEGIDTEIVQLAQSRSGTASVATAVRAAATAFLRRMW